MEINLDELECQSFWGRTHSGLVYTVDDKWVIADGNRDSAQAIATLIEPLGDHGWTVVIEKRSRDDEYAWEPWVFGSGLRLTYSEAEQVAYAFQTEGETDFDFHKGIALSITGHVDVGQFSAMLSERYDERRTVYFKKEEDGWCAAGVSERWDEHITWFVRKRGDPRFPEHGYGDLETVRSMAYDWAIQPALEDTDRASAWWLGRSTNEVLSRKTV